MAWRNPVSDTDMRWLYSHRRSLYACVRFVFLQCAETTHDHLSIPQLEVVVTVA